MIIQAHRTMFRSPDRYGYLTATYEPVKRFLVSLSGTYTGSMLVQHFSGYIQEDTERKTPDFYDIGMKFQYEFLVNGQMKINVNCGIQNMLNSYQNDFDKGQFRDAGYIYGPSLPRSFFMGVKISY